MLREIAPGSGLFERACTALILCASKDNEVVEYALSRALSPALVAEYQTQLPDKRLLRAKLHELYAWTHAKAPVRRALPPAKNSGLRPR